MFGRICWNQLVTQPCIWVFNKIVQLCIKPSYRPVINHILVPNNCMLKCIGDLIFYDFEKCKILEDRDSFVTLKHFEISAIFGILRNFYVI